MGYKNRFGINYPDKFLDKVGNLQDAASKETVGKKRLLAQAAKISPPGRVFGFLTGFLNKAKNAGKKLFDQKMKEFEQYENEDPMGRFGRKIVNGKAMSFKDYSIDAFAEMFGEDIRTDRYYAQFLNQIGQRGISSTLFGSIF